MHFFLGNFSVRIPRDTSVDIIDFLCGDRWMNSKAQCKTFTPIANKCNMERQYALLDKFQNFLSRNEETRWTCACCPINRNKSTSNFRSEFDYYFFLPFFQLRLESITDQHTMRKSVTNDRQTKCHRISNVFVFGFSTSYLRDYMTFWGGKWISHWLQESNKTERRKNGSSYLSIFCKKLCSRNKCAHISYFLYSYITPRTPYVHNQYAIDT